MNSTKDRIRANLREVKGKIKEKVGQVTNNSGLEAEGQAEENTGKVERKTEQTDPKHVETACLAYQNWQRRGCPVGTPEEDWFRAEEELKQSLNEPSNSSETGKQGAP